MKVDMSPQAIENRLKLVGELTKACLLIRQNSLEIESNPKRLDNKFPKKTIDKKL